jgi:hypothetical protein
MSRFRHEHPGLSRCAAALGILLCASLVACETGNTGSAEKQALSENYTTACEQMCAKMGECVPVVAKKNAEILGDKPEAQKLLAAAEARAAQGATACRKELCAKTVGRPEDVAKRETKALNDCLQLNTCKKFVGCMESLRVPKK